MSYHLEKAALKVRFYSNSVKALSLYFIYAFRMALGEKAAQKHSISHKSFRDQFGFK